jgi:hypothetical protein
MNGNNEYFQNIKAQILTAHQSLTTARIRIVVNIEEAAIKNNNYRTAIWTGKNMQVTLMCIP